MKTPEIYFVPVNNIAVPPGRFREQFDDTQMKQLQSSIQQYGLLHPIVVRAADNGFELVAGERRLRAIQKLITQGIPFRVLGKQVEVGCVPVHLFEDLEKDTALEIELEENIRRAQLTWQEEAAAVHRLYQVRRAKDPTWNQTDTVNVVANLKNTDPANVRAQVGLMLVLGQHLNRPEVVGAGSAKEALKNFMREIERDTATELARIVNEEPTSLPIDVRNVDALIGMSLLEEESVDLVITDPPYGINATRMPSFGKGNLHTYLDEWDEISRLMDAFMKETFRVCKPKAHMYVFCDVRRFFDLSLKATAAGWDVWKTPMLWVKNGGLMSNANFGPRHVYECILFANKGNLPVRVHKTDVLIYALESDRSHAAQKPIAVYTDLLTRSVGPGSKILDPFCGSGTVFLAAEKALCTAIGMDTDPACITMSLERWKTR